MTQTPSEANEPTDYSYVLDKVSWRIIPFMLLLYVVAYLDRINVSFAGLQMNQDLGFDDKVFGLGAGAFFIGYFLFGVPSNIMVKRLGARKWIAIIMVIWGAISTSMCLVQDVFWFYTMRFLLGVAEAGFFPGMILYLTFWFPKREHAKAVARFMTAIPLAGVLGGIVSSRVLLMHGVMGLPGWKWLFIITGTPAILLGLVVLFKMLDGPHECKWLSDAERNWLLGKIKADQIPSISTTDTPSLEDSKPAAELVPDESANNSEKQNVFTSLRVWHLAFLYFSLALGMYGFQLWLPQIIKSFDHSSIQQTAAALSTHAESANADSQAALLSAIPAVFQGIGMVCVAMHSDKKQERRLHIFWSSVLAAAGLMACGFCHDPILSLACLSLTAFGIWGTVGPFWAIPTAYLKPESAAAGIGLINAVGNLGGFAGPYIVGLIKHFNSDFVFSLAALAASLVVAGFLALAIKPIKTES